MDPIAINQALRAGGDHLLQTSLSEPFLYPGFEVAALQKALVGLSDEQRVAVLGAAERQSAEWERVTRTDSVPMSAGAIAHSYGDFDAVMMLLIQQGLAHRAARSKPEDPSQSPYLVAMRSRLNTDDRSGVESLQYTGGIHKRRGSLHKFPEPFRTIAFHLEHADNLVGRFDLHCLTPIASRIEDVFSSKLAQQLRYGSLVLYSPKSFSPTGLDMDQWTERVLKGTGREGEVATAYVSGFAGANAIFTNDLPYLEDERTQGLHLGIGTTNLERGLALAMLLTDSTRDQSETTMVGGAQVYTFKNLFLDRPLVVSVYDDPDLRKTQLLYSHYKNIYSGINTEDLFQYIWAQLEESQGQINSGMIQTAEKFYEGLMQNSQQEILEILTKVEGIPSEKAKVLPLTESDARESWRVKDMGRFFALIKNLFFDIYDENGQFNARKFTAARDAWIRDLASGRIFATRNPAAGASIAAGNEAFRYLLVNDLYDLMPPGVVFEGLNTALNLDHRLMAEQLEALPPRVKDFIEKARQLRRPQVIPIAVRDQLSHLASCLVRLSSGQPPATVVEAEAFLIRPVKPDELTRTFKWTGNLTVITFLKAVSSLKTHLEAASSGISNGSPQRAKLAQPLVREISRMIKGIQQIEEETRKANAKKPLENAQLQRLMHALKLLILEGDRFYIVDEDVRGVMRNLRGRILGIISYLRGKTLAPYQTKIT